MPNKRSFISTDPAAWTARQRRRAMHDKFYKSNRPAPSYEAEEVHQDAIGQSPKLVVSQGSSNPPPRGNLAYNRDAWADLSDSEPDSLAPSSAVFRSWLPVERAVPNGGLPLWRASSAECWERVPDFDSKVEDREDCKAESGVNVGTDYLHLHAKDDQKSVPDCWEEEADPRTLSLDSQGFVGTCRLLGMLLLRCACQC